MTALILLTALPLTMSHDGATYCGLTLAELRGQDVPAPALLDAVRTALCEHVDREAERRRGLVVTAGAGQAMEYQEAQAQAERALALPGATPIAPGDFPMLEASIGIDTDPESGQPASDVLGVARAVETAYAAWQQVGAAIRAARLRGKSAIRAAASVEAACDAHDGIAWPVL